MKDQLQEGEVIISEDFSENYALKQQNEIMTAHWSNESITLFCATVHFKEAGKKRFQHYVLVSDDLKHEKDSIWYNNNFIINDVRKKGIAINKKVYYWSDGPSCQFKNQYHFSNIMFHEEDHGTPAAWNYFAISHGKGENDGVGGDVKNYVWRKTLQKKVVVTTAQEFVDLAKQKFPEFVIHFCSSDDIRAKTMFLKQRYLKYSKPVPKTLFIHHVDVVENKLVSSVKSPSCKCHSRSSNDASAKSVSNEGSSVGENEEIKSGDYVKVV